MEVRIEHLTKTFIAKSGKVTAVNDMSFVIPRGKLVGLLGPSGCGKTTVLYMIAGLEKPDEGKVWFGDEDVTLMAPENRRIGLVFQNYALYPHLTVFENIAFPLRLRKTPQAEVFEKVTEAAEILGITEYLNRKPRALSGGQRQRVAIGRAMVRHPKVFLMDEPLSNLDAKLRNQMRAEIILLRKRIDTTFIYVTHDQTEAMTMATRIVVMKDGYIQQVGSPKEIYNNPANMFVANFVGAPAMNFIHGRVEKEYFVLGDRFITIPGMYIESLKAYDGKEVVLGIRPEDIHAEGIVGQTFPDTPFEFKVDVAELLGHEFILHGSFAGQPILAKVDAREDIHGGQTLKLSMDVAKVKFFDPETEQRIV